DAPARSVPELLALRDEMAALADHPWKADKLRELDDLILAACGLWADATVADPVAVPGGELALRLSALDRSAVPVTVRELHLPGREVVRVDHALAEGQPFTVERSVRLPPETPYTQPYWLAAPAEPGRWVVRDRALAGLPAAPPLAVEVVLAFGARTLTLAR